MDPAARVAPIREIVEAFTVRDTERFVSHMTEDMLLRPSAFITGKGEYTGLDEIRDGMAELAAQQADSGEQIDVRIDAYYVDADADDVVLTLGEVTIRRPSGETFGTDIAYLWTMRGDLVSEMHGWLDHAEGMSRLAKPVEVT